MERELGPIVETSAEHNASEIRHTEASSATEYPSEKGDEN